MKKIFLVLFSFVLFVAPNVKAFDEVREWQTIYLKAINGDVQGLIQMKRMGLSLDLEDKSGNTPYCAAVKTNNPVAVRALEVAGADTSPWCMWGTNFVTQAMIYEAASDRDTKKIAYWKKHGIPIDITDNYSGDTALCKAVYRGDCVAIDTLIKSGANQYHTCIQNIPESVRRSLNCKEVVRDWSKVGYTILGLGLVGGGIAALAGGGGGGTKPACGYGEHWDGEKCVHCAVDEYWSPSSGCEPCPSGSFSTGYESQCTRCSNNQRWNGSECVDCPKGSFSAGDTKNCTTCNANQFWNGTHCQDCEPGSYSDGKTEECTVCSSTQYWNAGACRDCKEGYHNENNECVPCQEDHYWGGTSCVRCPGGQHGNGVTCTACADGTYWNGSVCISCPVPENICGVPPDEYYDDERRCPMYKQLTCVDGVTYCSGNACVACPTVTQTSCSDSLVSDILHPITKCVIKKKIACGGETPSCNQATGICESCASKPVEYKCGIAANEYYEDGICPKVLKIDCPLGEKYCDSDTKQCVPCDPDLIENRGCNVQPVTNDMGCYIAKNVPCTDGKVCDTSTPEGRCVECVTDANCKDGTGKCEAGACRYDLCKGEDGDWQTFGPGKYRDSLGYCRDIAPGVPSTSPETGTETEYARSIFLSEINADSAYQKGYTGFIVNRISGNNQDKDFGPLVSPGDKISTNKIKVGVISTGINTDDAGTKNADNKTYYPNPDFKNSDGSSNLSSSNFNFDYGPCSGTDKKNCYELVESRHPITDQNSYLVFYNSNGDKYYLDALTMGFRDWETSDQKEELYRLDEDEYDKMEDFFEGYTDNYQLNDDNKYNVNPHYIIDGTQDNTGTALAGIIGAAQNNNGILGVAYNSEIISAIADVFRPYEAGGNSDAVTVLKINGAKVVLQSKPRYVDGYTANDILEYTRDGLFLDDLYSDSEVSAFETIAAQSKNGTFENQATALVVPTGDYTGNNTISGGIVTSQKVNDASIGAGAPLSQDWTDSDNLDGLFVSVTAVEKVGDKYVLMENALPCGATGSYCLSAPGRAESTVSTTSKTEYATDSVTGTQVAAATVTGSIALLQAAYQHLSTPEIVEILFKTATPLGSLASRTTEGADSLIQDDWGDYSYLYGHGMINLEAATQPLGALWVHDADNHTDRIGTAESTATVSAMALSAFNNLPQTMVAYDDYARPFPVSLTDMITVHREEEGNLREEFNAFMAGRDKTTVKPNETFSMAYAPRYSDRSADVPHGQMEMNMNFGAQQFNLFYTEDMMQSHGGSYFERVLNNPLVQIQEAYGFETAYQLNPKFSVTGAFATGYNGFLGDGDEDYDAPENRISSYQVGMAYRPKKSITFKTAYGVMNENESVLGMMGQGAFDIKGASTAFVSAGLTLRPVDKLKLDLMYTYGWTNPERGDGIMQFSKLTSDGFALVAQYDLGDDNMLGFSVSSPLRVNSGKVSVNMPVGRDGEHMYSKWYSADLKPTARELDFALFYKDQLTPDLFIQSELSVRLNPDHQADASADYRGLFCLKYNY